MAKRPLPDQALLLKLLRYEPETGKLYWLERSPALFRGAKDSTASCNTWNARYSGKPALTINEQHGYRIGAIFGKMFFAHRIIWKMMTGEDPDEIDHINGVRSDNRWSNLRNVDTQSNRMNASMQGRNSSGVCGVAWQARTRSWRAWITARGKYIHLGRFKVFEDAVRARKKAERKYGFHPNHGRQFRSN